MSLILAIVSKRIGVVGSDGRMFGSVFLSNGRALSPVEVESEECDKTFEIPHLKIIGACCGLMRFGGKQCAEHLVEGLCGDFTKPSPLSEAAERLQKTMVEKLNQISPQEVDISSRNLDVILVGSEIPFRADFRIAALRFKAENGSVHPAPIVFVVPDGQNRYQLFGDDKAQKGCMPMLAGSPAHKRDVTLLRSVAVQAISAGIKTAGPHPYGEVASCGGKSFTKMLI